MPDRKEINTVLFPQGFHQGYDTMSTDPKNVLNPLVSERVDQYFRPGIRSHLITSFHLFIWHYN
jgi:hypothetical protein